MRRLLVAVTAAALLAACTTRPAPPPPAPQGPSVAPRAQSQPEKLAAIVDTVNASVPPRPEQTWINSVAFATPERGWILRGEGEALATTDGGETWRPASLPYPFTFMSFSTPRLGHAGFQDRLFRTTDGGETWAPLDTTGWPSTGAFFLDEQHGWTAGPREEAFYRTQDGGRTWEKLPDPCPKEGRRPFSFISPTTGWLLCGFDEGMGAMSKRLYRTDDGGLSWTLLGEALVGQNGEPSKGKEWPGGLPIGDYVGDLFFLDERHGWYTGVRYGSFMATQDGGRTWQDVSVPPLRGAGVRFISPTVGYRYGVDTSQDAPWVLTMTRDGGRSWTQVYPRRQPRQRFFLDARTYIGELDGSLYRSDDGGVSWRLLSKLPAPLHSLFYTSREQAWALMGTEKEHHLYRSADGGATWEPVAAALDLAPYQRVQGLDGQTAILWDHANRLLITRDGGATFTALNAPQDQFGGHGFFFTSAETGWFARAFRLHRTVDGGKHWEAIPLPEHWKAQGVAVGPDGRLWASIVDTADQYTPVPLTLASADGGATWTRYDLGSFNQPGGIHRCGLTSLCVESGGFPHGIVSHDGGATWHYYHSPR